MSNKQAIKIALIMVLASVSISLSLLALLKISKPNFKVGQCIVNATLPPWDKDGAYSVAKVLQTSDNHVQLTQAPYYLGEYTMAKKDLQDFEVVECPPVEVLPEEEAGETCGH